MLDLLEKNLFIHFVLKSDFLVYCSIYFSKSNPLGPFCIQEKEENPCTVDVCGFRH